MAILLAIVLVAVWMFIGLGLFSIMRFHTQFHLRLLLAPTLGFAFTVLSLFTLSRIGLPIKTVSAPLFFVEILLAMYFLFSHRLIWKRQAFLTYCLLILISISPFAWPLFRFGFEWLAFVNGDMSYYSTSSTRLLDYGYSELPTSGNINDIKDHSLLTWTFHNDWSYRTGADLLLAYLVGLTGLTAHQVYMPLIVAFNSCVVSGAGALTLAAIRRWSVALWVMALVTLSPMLTLEVTMQQLAQAAGLALLTSLCVSYEKVMTGSRLWPWRIYTIFSFSGLAISYFEIIPFFALYVFISEAIRWERWMNATNRKIYLHTVLITACGITLLLNSYMLNTVERIIFAAKMSFSNSQMTMQTDGVSVFPYFFLPSNGALLWGWVPLSGQANSLLVVIGLLATFLFLGMLITSKIRSMPGAQMSIVMFAVAISMWIGGNGYGLFKIAMFIQPFLLATFAAVVVLLVTKHLFQKFGFAFLGLSFIPAQQMNIALVSSDVGSPPVAYASTAKLGKQLRELRDTVQSWGNIKIFSDTPSFELFSLEAYYFKGIAFDNLARALPLLKSIGEPIKFEFSAGPDPIVADLRSKKYTGSLDEYLLTTTGEFSVVNRGSATRGHSLVIKPLRAWTNHLILQTPSSGAGRLNTDTDIASYQLERDPSFRGGTMSAVGQYHVYEVLGATEGSRLQLSLSASYNKDEEFRLPSIRAVGSIDQTLPLVGRGSARLLSAPISPRKIGSADYIGIDFGRKGVLVDRERNGAMALFGKNIKLDIRKVVVHARDISYISSERYTTFNRPQKIEGFPVALENEGLEYSGIFEDGWISEAAFVILKAPVSSARTSLNISGLVPDIGGVPFSPTLTIKVNDQLVYRARQKKGEVNIIVSLDPVLFKKNPVAKVQIESSELQRLPNGDNRPVSMHLNMIGLK